MSQGTPEAARVRAAGTYNAASDHYDDAANTFWARFGRRTIERLGLEPGTTAVLDVCCGSGASAIPAAETVGGAGCILGVDLAEDLLALARAKARQRGLERQLAFRAADMLDVRLPDGSFDAVVCVFGIFFVPDMEAATRELWRLVRPGGRLAITTWGPRMFEPMNSAFWNAVREVRPELFRTFSPWDRINEPETLGALLEQAGITAPQVVAEEGRHAVPTFEAWWSLVLGSGYRGTLEQLDAADREHVRQANEAAMREAGVTAVEANVIYAVATRPVAVS